jgi:hypothetical protein
LLPVLVNQCAAGDHLIYLFDDERRRLRAHQQEDVVLISVPKIVELLEGVIVDVVVRLAALDRGDMVFANTGESVCDLVAAL